MAEPDKPPGRYVAAIITRVRRGKLNVLVLKTIRRSGPNKGLVLIQVPGGMEEVVDQGNPFRALDGELDHETGFRLRLNYPDPELIHQQTLPDGHIRSYYHVRREGLRGELRNEGIGDGTKWLEVPEWKSVDFLKKNICESQEVILPFLTDLDLRHKGLK